MQLKFKDAGVAKRLLVGLILAFGLVLLLSALRYNRSGPIPIRPAIGLMTTLPLQWSEGGIEADLSAKAEPHPAYARIQQHYDIRPVDSFDSLDRQSFSMLILAQPRALAPTELVRLDAWVRVGGRLLIFADPALQWGSLYPLGDKRRPLFTSLLSPLFSHWGLELVLPLTDEQPVVRREVDGRTIRTQTPGEWIVKAGGKDATCKIAQQKLLADCTIGKGRALLIADADLLDTVYWEGQGVRAITGGDEFANLAWVDAMLTALHDGTKMYGDSVGK
jgi:hypothetical protein